MRDVGITFNPSERSTLGVEVELQLVDRDTRALASAASPILDELDHPKAKHELLECCIELNTDICDTVAQARDDLSTTLKLVADAADARGLDLVCAGSHPFSYWNDQRISPSERYAAMMEEFQWVGRRLQIFGVHFHVGVRSAEKAIATANALRAYVPHFLALSASSPYWEGLDTGLASCRSSVFENLPTAGLPYVMSGWDEFERFMGTLITAGAISTIREVWWDIRPHPDFGTVELRICDGIPTLREVSGLAALAQCLVHDLDRRIDAREPLVVPRDWTVRQNKWRAARHGVDADIIADETGRQMRLGDDIGCVVDRLAPVAADLGCAGELAVLEEILDGGPSYVRQRRVFEGGGTLADIVDALVDELRNDQAPA